jgi:hypothetical protein
MDYKTVNEYNNYLVVNKIQIDIINYVKTVNKISFNIDISFIDEFIELVNKDDCCIHHNMLQKYGIISGGNTTSVIKRLLEQYDMEEYHDFLLYNVVQQKSGSGGSNKKEYYLHPNAFKICLIRSLKTKKYAKYYLLLEKCIKYYNDYQQLLKEQYIIKLKDKIKVKNNIITESKNEIADLKDMMKEQEKKAEERYNKLIRQNKKVIDKLDDAHTKLDISNE